MKMKTSLEVFFVILAIVEFIIAMLGNVFIGLVNCCEWVKTQKISFFDLILTGLAIFRISQLLLYLLESFVMGPFPEFYTTYKLAKPFSLLWRITNHWTTWFATCLSVFYLLKVAQFSHPLFLWLKWRLNKVVLMILVLSLFVLIFDFFLLETFNDLFQDFYAINGHSLNSSVDKTSIFHVKSLILLNLTSCIPIMVTLTSLLFLFLSLVRHTKNLQLNSLGTRDTNIEAHKKAMIMMMSFLALFIVHFIFTQLASWIFHMFWSNKFTKFILLAVYVFPLGHSFILILGNSKLRRTALKGLYIFKASFCLNLGFKHRIFCSLFRDKNLKDLGLER